MTDKHTARIEIFDSTLSLLEQGWYMSPSGHRIALPSVEKVMRAAKMYCSPLHMSTDPIERVDTEIRVENNDCILAAKELIDAGYNPAMLNLADLETPGGLVEYGSGAQEETLCRRSNLILSLYQFSHARIYEYPNLGLKQNEDQYPMDERYGGIYSGIVTFFRGPESDGSMLEEIPYNIPVISVAAIEAPRIDAVGRLFPEETELTLEKMRTIFRIGMVNQHDSLVLSAMGCGAFANPPEHIARLFHQVIEEDEFKNRFRLIVFAILDGFRTGLRHNPDGNFLPFLKEFGSNNKPVRQHIVFFTGAGISAESGIPIFRGTDGLWNHYDPEKVSTAAGLYENPEQVLSFYNKRRLDIMNAQPNAAHKAIAQLENYHDVTVITQNIDDLHERAGSTKVIHIHGDCRRATSSKNRTDPESVIDWPLNKPMTIHDHANDGSQLRPFVVFFDEYPDLEMAEEVAREADVFVIIGTSLSVSSSVLLPSCPRRDVPRYIIDPKDHRDKLPAGYLWIKETATTGMRIFTQEALNEFPMFNNQAL